MDEKGIEVVEGLVEGESVVDIDEKVVVEDVVEEIENDDGKEKEDVKGVNRGWSGPKVFMITFTGCLVLSSVLGIGVFVITDYESVQYGRYDSDDIPGVFIRVYLRMEGPFTDHKDASLRYVVFEGIPSIDIGGYNLTVDAHGTEKISCHFDGGYVRGEYVWAVEYGKSGDCDGSVQFLVSGNVFIAVTVELESGVTAYLRGAGDDQKEGAFSVLPKADDDSWFGGRVAAVGLVIGVSWAIVPNGVKTFRDILKGG